jgi:hypothetical protein
MELVKLAITFPFALAHVSVTWRLLRYGLVQQLTTRQALLDFATHEFSQRTNPPEALCALMWLSRKDSITEPVDALANLEPFESDDYLRSVWLFLVIRWMFEHVDESELWVRMEWVYADFGYPEQMRGFVPYMPYDAPLAATNDGGTARMRTRLVHYLNEAESMFKPNGSGG